MTIDEGRCRQILAKQKETGRSIKVTFNYRYAPPRTQVKELLMSGVIGDVMSVSFEWLLNVRHGADYFRRWHRHKENSGGLLVHKATHHFDLVNWWLSTVPETVYANGHRRFYTPQTADRYGLTNRSERCHTCPESDNCRFCLKLADNKNQRAGAWSILTGVAGNRSMAEKRPVRIDELVSDLALPDYPAMPTAAEPLPGPDRTDSIQQSKQ